MKKLKIAVLGIGQRGGIYANHAIRFNDKYELVAIIENDLQKKEIISKRYSGVKLFTDYHQFINANIQADIVAVSTQDKDHKEHAIALLEAGYNLLLEKPIANTLEDCLAIYKASKQFNRTVIVCHVLRYTPFYSTLKSILEKEEVGNIINIHASENVGFYHQAHSFVRGPWRNSENSSPMILAKCCHDMDILRFLIGKKCLSVSSIGNLSYFCKENAPKDAAKFCSKCFVKDCLFNAQKFYTNQDYLWMSNYFNLKEPTEENILAALENSDYDICVFYSDNDVVDHQSTILNFEGGITACHTMTAFSKEIYRDIKVHCTKAEILGNVEKNELKILFFDGRIEQVEINKSKSFLSGHMGGDFAMMESIYNAIVNNDCNRMSFIDVSVESHIMCIKAEESRLENGKNKRII